MRSCRLDTSPSPSSVNFSRSSGSLLLARRETLKWVEWFNNRRLLEPIGYIPPAEAEERYYAQFNALDMVASREVISLRQTRRGSISLLHFDETYTVRELAGMGLVLVGTAIAWT